MNELGKSHGHTWSLGNDSSFWCTCANMYCWTDMKAATEFVNSATVPLPCSAHLKRCRASQGVCRTHSGFAVAKSTVECMNRDTPCRQDAQQDESWLDAVTCPNLTHRPASLQLCTTSARRV